MTVLEAVKRSKTPSLMQKGSIKAAQSMLLDSEEILWAMTANVSLVAGSSFEKPDALNMSNKRNGVVVVTTERIFFVNCVLGVGTTKELRLSQIRTMETNNVRFSACLRVVSIADTLEIDGAPKALSALRTAISQALSRKDTAAADSDALEQSDVEQLQALKQLYDTGVITEEEFTAKKAQILGL